MIINEVGMKWHVKHDTTSKIHKPCYITNDDDTSQKT